MITAEAERSRIEIVNKGVIPLALRERFFDKFVTGGKASGTGLDTYSARMLARTLFLWRFLTGRAINLPVALVIFVIAAPLALS
jgi:hypothetical protein